MDKTQIIAKLNDQFRTDFMNQDLGKVFLSEQVSNMANRKADNKLEQLKLDKEYSQILSSVLGFDKFNQDNNPHGEHDFGAFEVNDEKYFWKIDYYNKDMSGGSEDPSDPSQTTRVLTIMHSSEY